MCLPRKRPDGKTAVAGWEVARSTALPSPAQPRSGAVSSHRPVKTEYERAASYITRAPSSEAWPAPMSSRGRGRPSVLGSRGDAKPPARRAHDDETAHFNDGNDEEGMSSIASGSAIDDAGSLQSSNSDISPNLG